MLVTIASNNDNDASHFTNHFPEGLIIPKGASIGVVNCSYILREGYVIQTGINDVFQIKLGNMTDYIDVTIAAGSYETLDLLATAVQTAIATAIGTQSAFIQACYPVAEQTVSGDDQASELTIHFVFDLASQDPDFLEVGVNTFVEGNVTGSKGGYINDNVQGAVVAPGGAQARTSNGGANQNFLVASHKNPTTGAYEAIFRAEYQSVGYESQLLLKTSANQGPASSPIQVVFTGAGQVEIYELIGGVRTQINSGAQAIASGNRVEIRVPEVDPDQQQTIVASYFITAGGQTSEIPVVAPAAGRRAISQYDEFIPAVDFVTNSASGIVVPGNSKNNALNDFNINALGANYEVGDFVQQNSTTGAGSGIHAIISGTDGNGGVTDIKLVATGSLHAGGDIIGFGGGNGNGFELRVGSTFASIALTTGGSGYVQGQDYNVTGGTGAGAQVKALAVNAGVVTAVSVVTGGSGYSLGDVLTLSAGGSNSDCTITIGRPVEQVNRITNARATLIAAPMNMRPLVLKRIIRVKMGTFNDLFNGHARYDTQSGDLKITSGKIVSNNRAASNIHIQLNDFGPIESREKGSNGKTVAVVPLGDNTNTATGLFNNELFNIVYHKLQNPEPLSNNEMSVRLTDFNSNTLPSLRHPVTITFDIRPDVV